MKPKVEVEEEEEEGVTGKVIAVSHCLSGALLCSKLRYHLCASAVSSKYLIQFILNNESG